ncbi:hypothetical protein AB0878_49040 [Amycolatopsis sp. NPDC047767]|uniref:hypothetical protein n=1 Tax=Amycolatopsis sp. NPDC047767 TaxID=3156765 RepID=UPI0034572981
MLSTITSTIATSTPSVNWRWIFASFNQAARVLCEGVRLQRLTISDCIVRGLCAEKSSSIRKCASSASSVSTYCNCSTATSHRSRGGSESPIHRTLAGDTAGPATPSTALTA